MWVNPLDGLTLAACGALAVGPSARVNPVRNRFGIGYLLSGEPQDSESSHIAQEVHRDRHTVHSRFYYFEIA